MDVGPPELLIVLVIALVLFGGKKIPQLARSLGQAKSEFEKGARGEKDLVAEPEADPEPEPEPRELTADTGDDPVAKAAEPAPVEVDGPAS